MQNMCADNIASMQDMRALNPVSMQNMRKHITWYPCRTCMRRALPMLSPSLPLPSPVPPSLPRPAHPHTHPAHPHTRPPNHQTAYAPSSPPHLESLQLVRSSWLVIPAFVRVGLLSLAVSVGAALLLLCLLAPPLLAAPQPAVRLCLRAHTENLDALPGAHHAQHGTGLVKPQPHTALASANRPLHAAHCTQHIMAATSALAVGVAIGAATVVSVRIVHGVHAQLMVCRARHKPRL
eukprot:360328-Chlamydomonas_euryale.AAC.21